MSRAVDHVLAQRARRAGRRPEAASLIAALALHALVVAAAWALPRLQDPPRPPEHMPVTIIPAQALGVPRPAPPRQRPAPPAPEPAVAEPEPEPEPAPEPEPEPEPPAPEPEDVPVLPKKEPEKKPEKKPDPPKPAETPRKPAETAKRPAETTKKPPEPRKPAETPRKPAPSQTAAGTGEAEDRGDQTGRRGAATGSPTGSTAFGSEIAGIDNPDFTYGYYLDRLLSLIDAQWVRPPLGSGIRAVISFRIQRDGSMTDLRVSQSSGYNTFDLAAYRAVQNASPFPPLPRAYNHDSLGVNLIVR